MINAAMLQVIQDCGEDVLVLADGLDEAALLRSRLTRAEVCRRLALMAGTIAALPAAARTAMPEIDWAGWGATAHALDATGPAQADALWFAVRSLVPATLSWLRVYRQEQPAWFAYAP